MMLILIIAGRCHGPCDDGKHFSAGVYKPAPAKRDIQQFLCRWNQYSKSNEAALIIFRHLIFAGCFRLLLHKNPILFFFRNKKRLSADDSR
jgi:hypothetical protein